ncbi:MAG TPA: alpha/beta fold hydrolase [bacterium]|nr:alpha/beta fold hydrolase [bacterium]
MTLLLLHPLGLDSECWQFIELQATKPDLPGHGHNPLRGDELTIERVADEVLERVDGAADVVGVSMGGTLAVRMALRDPKRIRSLMVACTSVLDSPERSQRLRERATSVDRAGMAGVLNSTLERWFTPAALANPEHPGVTYARRRLLSDDARAFAMWWRAMAAHAVREEIGMIRCPVTMLAGRHDAAAPMGHVLEVFDALHAPRRMEVLAGPHMLPLENPSLFADAVRLHLHWVESIAGSQPQRPGTQ